MVRVPDTLAAINSAASGFLEGDEPELALPLYLKAVTMATTAGSQEVLSGLLGDLAVTYRRLGALPTAIATNRRAIEVRGPADTTSTSPAGPATSAVCC